MRERPLKTEIIPITAVPPPTHTGGTQGGRDGGRGRWTLLVLEALKLPLGKCLTGLRPAGMVSQAFNATVMGAARRRGIRLVVRNRGRRFYVWLRE